MPEANAPYQLLVVSNRLPELRTALTADTRRKNVGGLVAALEPALRARHGVWLGWSGQRCADGPPGPHGLHAQVRPALAWVDFTDAWHRHYYNGLCNSALWPLLHSFPGHMQLSHRDWGAYREVNAAFAEVAGRLIGPDCPVWVHDYHLLLLGRELRARGHRGPVGLFLHIPFPCVDIFSLFPWAEETLEALLDLDLIGFHTQSYAENFRYCAVRLLGARDLGDAVEHRGRRTRVGAFPIGIIPESYQGPVDAAVAEEVATLMRAIAPSRLVLGVDRLDYTKGIPERLMAFGRFLGRFPEWRGKVSLVQISVPSREEVQEYAEQRARVENTVGRVNGEFGEAHWVPIRYLYRSYGRAHLSELYRAADVGYVTALRDGMNLVAKEYVAAQDAERPGVLLLSKFAGAAEELREAVLTNPWDVEGMSQDLDRALRMEPAERRSRHAALLRTVSQTTALSWAEDFLEALGGCRPM
jgi:alpha,alpha-trehalose-phosphate synthase [UDP-forming]